MTKDDTKDIIDWVIFDLDGTLADINHRLQLIKEEKYNESMSEIPGDKLKKDIYSLYTMAYDSGINIALVTGRRRTFQLLTEQWLEKHNINYDELHMRHDDDYRSDHEVKQDILTNNFSRRNILFVVDDREKVTRMWRSNGITCLQCQEGDY